MYTEGTVRTVPSVYDATCFSETNLLYMKNFYLLYQPYLQIAPQVGEQITQKVAEQRENAITPQLVEQIQNDLFSVPWGHHRFIIDKFKEQPEKAEIEAKLSAR